MTKLRRSIVTAGAVLALAASLAACGSSSSSGDPSASGGSGAAAAGGSLAGKDVTFLTLTPTCDPCAHTSNAVVKTLEAEGINVTTESSDFGAAADQIQKFNQALSTKPAAIVIWPTDTTSLIPALQLAKQNNPEIPIIITTYKPDTPDTDLYAAFVGGDDNALGAAQAQALVDGLKAAGKPAEGGVIEIEGVTGAATTIGRKTGFDEKLAEIAPGLKIVGSQPGDWDQTKATTAASALFAQYANDNIVGVYAHSDVMLNGAILAAERANLTPGKDIIAVGIDCSIEGLTNIKSGKQYATGMWDPNVIGSLTGEQAVKVMEGEQVTKDTYFETPQITQANLSDCTWPES